MSIIQRLFGDQNARTITAFQDRIRAIGEREKHFEGLSDDRLREAAIALRTGVRQHADLERAMVDAFALVREAAKRTLGQRHFDEQLVGGMVLHQGLIAEMKTGEGKTLAATAPVFLNALLGKGVHVVTVNDYLARRDTVWMGRLYHALGMSVGCIQHDAAFLFDPAPEGQGDSAVKVEMTNLRPVGRREAYAADITYGTNNEFGFDYLRDNMTVRPEQEVQRPLHFAIVDEVDSILIDEARTPLIISAPAEDSGALYARLAQLIVKLSEGAHYNVDEKMRTTTLTQEGISKIAELLGEDPYATRNFELVHHIEVALKASRNFIKDKQYVVKDGEIVIVDEFTGRLMPGRRFSEGIHQAIEAKEGVAIKQESRTLATVTFQNYFRMYEKLSGMTGTAKTEEEEFQKIYGLDVVVVPTHRPMVRRDIEDKVYKSRDGKLAALIEDVRTYHERGQPVLIGTISIDANEELSERLRRAGIPHEVLNAKNHEREAEIIAQAGAVGAVTVATNMAGRGVDIVLGGYPKDDGAAERVRGLGGVAVLGTERHESRRIDNQLRGRSGRQGDPGVSQFYVSVEDDLMRIFGSDRMRSLMDRLGLPEDVPIQNKLVSRSIESAQKKVEGYNFDTRKHLVGYDDVVNRHRDVIYKRRHHLLHVSNETNELRDEVMKLIVDEIEQVISFHTATDEEEKWNLDEVYEVMDAMFGVTITDRVKLEDIRATAGDKEQDAHSRTSIIRYFDDLAKRQYASIEKQIADQRTMRELERQIMLRTIDRHWIEHLDQMEYLRTGIGLRGYGQRDPLIEYKREAFELFTALLAEIQSDVVNSIYKVRPATATTVDDRPAQNLIIHAPSKEADARTSQFAFAREQESHTVPQQSHAASTSGAVPAVTAKLRNSEGQKVGRNDPCPCGSGKKYKKCHGA